MTRDLLCEVCLNPVDRTREPFRSRTHDAVAPDGAPGRSYVHAVACELPDTGEWDGARRGLPPAAIRHAAAQADHR